mgnify:CR=1 FL=1
MVTSLKKDLSILLYENDQLLNSILHYQISNYENFNLLISENAESLFRITIEKKIDIFILNLDQLDSELNTFMKIFQIKNKNSDIVGYFENSFNNNENNFFLLKKPFKLKNLIHQLYNIKTYKNSDISNKFLMKHLIFNPSKKIVSNEETKHIEHLTEKENKLLNYLYNKKNIEILKKDLLINIWGVSDEINTHTLETHIYRLKQKLNKLDLNLSFSLINKNGLYCLKYNDK